MSSHAETLERVRGLTSTHDCPQCGGPAHCAMEAGKSSNLCWCMAEERTFNPDTQAAKCLCRYCLQEASK